VRALPRIGPGEHRRDTCLTSPHGPPYIGHAVRGREHGRDKPEDAMVIHLRMPPEDAILDIENDGVGDAVVIATAASFLTSSDCCNCWRFEMKRGFLAPSRCPRSPSQRRCIPAVLPGFSLPPLPSQRGTILSHASHPK
jgi:hypothetical protein